MNSVPERKVLSLNKCKRVTPQHGLKNNPRSCKEGNSLVSVSVRSTCPQLQRWKAFIGRIFLLLRGCLPGFEENSCHLHLPPVQCVYIWIFVLFLNELCGIMREFVSLVASLQWDKRSLNVNSF